MWLLALALLTADTAEVRDVHLAAGEWVRVTTAGEGTPVVLVHGLVGSAFAFRRIIPLLTDAGYRAVVIEPLGLGESARPADADYTLTAQAQRVAAAMDSLGVERALFIAHSLGASITLRLAIRRPALVRGILSLDGGPAETIGSSRFKTAMKLAPLIRLAGPGFVRARLRGRLVDASGDASWVTDEVVDGYTAPAARNLGEALAALSAMARAEEPFALAPRLSEIRCPVRLVVGTVEDRGGVPPREIELLRRSLRSFAIETIDGAGHFVFEERPEAVLASLLLLDTDRTRPIAAAGS